MSAAAPSEIELELAAVTVPPSLNMGFKKGILSGLAFCGCSSCETIRSLFLPSLTATGASVWSSSAWARRQIGNLSVSAEHGVSGSVSKSNPRDEMVPALVYQLTHDFRPSSVRQPAQ